jgi:hypothetical protein
MQQNNLSDQVSDDEYQKIEMVKNKIAVNSGKKSNPSRKKDENDLNKKTSKINNVEIKNMKKTIPIKTTTKISSNDKDGTNEEEDSTPNNESSSQSRPNAAGKDRKRIVTFEANIVTENEINEDDLYADENEINVLREIVKRKKLSKDLLTDEVEEQTEDGIQDSLNKPAEVLEVQVEKSKTPEIIEHAEDDEPYEITISMPDFSSRKDSLGLLKPSTKSVIRLAPAVEKKTAEKKPKRERIDVNSLRPKFTKRVQFHEEVEEDEEEEEIIVNSDDWLARWCIFRDGQNKKFEAVFDELDYMDKGYMNGESLIFALEKCLPLNNLKMTYLMRVMGLLDVDPFKFGANKKTFCVIAALGQRIQQLDDEWFRNLLPRLDLKSVENKVFKVKKLWDFLVDQDTKRVRLDDLMIEMKAGGVSNEHIVYAQEKFSDKISFDLLDYLTYVPLFIHIHEKICINPFNQNDQI